MITPARQAEIVGTIAALRERLDRAREFGEYDETVLRMSEVCGVSTEHLKTMATMNLTDVSQVNDVITLLGEDVTSSLEAKMSHEFMHAARMAGEALMEPPPNPTAPPWMAALDSQAAAMKMLGVMVNAGAGAKFAPPWGHSRDLVPELKRELVSGWQVDHSILSIAEAYAWYGDALKAVSLASASVPHDSRLSMEMTPGGGQGWWWFTPPLAGIATTSSHSAVSGLLWSLQERTTKQPGLGFDYSQQYVGFSVYVTDEFSGRPVPSTMWRWNLGDSFHEMIGKMSAEYHREYGAGGPFEKDQTVLGHDHTIKAIAQLSLFFLAACVWLQQKIVHVVPGHVERHRRKQLQREKKPSAVKVIALRRSHYEHADAPAVTEAPVDTAAREYRCSWVVRGHWRNQAHGPAHTERKLVFIHPYVADPAGKPLQERKRVFAVVR